MARGKIMLKIMFSEEISTSNFMAAREIWDKFPELFYKIA